MSLYLEKGTWWYEFTIEGKRYRSSTRTADKALAIQVEAEHRDSLTRTGERISLTLHGIKAAEKVRRTEGIWEGMKIQAEAAPAIEARKTKIAELTPSTLLREAGEEFLARQQERRRQKTLETNQGHLQRLLEFFGNIPLGEFTIAHLEHYQSVRGAKCAASTVNHELNTLGRMLKRVDLWHSIKKNYTPLKNKEWKAPKIFTAIEQERIFRALKNNPNLELGEIAFTLTRNTTASGCELRGLRLSSLELEADPPRIHIPTDSTKNNIRPRTIPLNADALDACMRAVERARKLGSLYPSDYLFPLRINRALWDPRKPTTKSWLRKQVDLLRKVTGIPHITPHVFRHLAVTELLERGASEQTVVALAGWVGRRMFETYSHPRLEAKNEAVQLLGDSVRKAPVRLPPAAPTTPAGDILAELAQLRQTVAQLQSQAQRSPQRSPAHTTGIRRRSSSASPFPRRLRAKRNQ